jgi:signal peptidase I
MGDVQNNDGVKEDVESKSNMKPKRSVLRKIIGWIIYLGVVAALVIYTPKLLSQWLGTDTPIAAITSGSMWPELKIGDLVLVQAVKKEAIQIGDIVVYKNKNGFTIHRVIEMKENVLTTKGDANNISDSPIEFKEIIGKTLEWGNGKPVRIPKLGYISIWASRTKNIK